MIRSKKNRTPDHRGRGFFHAENQREKEMQDVHTHCSLSSKTAEELSKTVSSSIDAGDTYGAYHSAWHHLMKLHLGVTTDKVKFFVEKLPELTAMVGDMVSPDTSLDEAMDRINNKSLPDQMRPFINGMVRQSYRQMELRSGVDIMTGIAVTMYVMSRGEYCIYGLIDKDLCKESS